MPLIRSHAQDTAAVSMQHIPMYMCAMTHVYAADTRGDTLQQTPGEYVARGEMFYIIFACGMLLHQQHPAMETRANTLLQQYGARGDVCFYTYMLLAGKHSANNKLQATCCSMLPAKTGDTRTAYLCVYIYIYRCIYTFTSTYVHRYVYVCMYVCRYMCVHIYVCT